MQQGEFPAYLVTFAWETISARELRLEKVFVHVCHLLSRGPLCSSELCKEKSPRHTSFTSSADTDEPAQLILNCRAPRVVEVMCSASTDSWVVLSAVNSAEFGRLHLSPY